MKRKELIKSILKADKVYAWVNWSKHDGTWMRIQKNDIIAKLKEAEDDTDYGAQFDNGLLFICGYSFGV